MALESAIARHVLPTDVFISSPPVVTLSSPAPRGLFRRQDISTLLIELSP